MFINTWITCKYNIIITIDIEYFLDFYYIAIIQSLILFRPIVS